MILDAISSSGLMAVHKGFARVDQAAAQIAKASMARGVDSHPLALIKPVVELQAADLETQAAIKLLDAENDRVGTLLNVRA